MATRREFLTYTGGSLLLGGLWGLGWLKEAAAPQLHLRQVTLQNLDLVAVEGAPSHYGQAVLRAVQALGGIQQFVHANDRVVISPNIGWMRTPDQAAATHPDIVRQVVLLCQQAGARTISVVDYTLDNAEQAFSICGAQDAVAGTMALLQSPDQIEMYAPLDVAAHVPAKTRFGLRYQGVHEKARLQQKVAKVVAAADVLISLPIIKDHEGAVMSGALKKLMGLVWERQPYHVHGLDGCIAELNLALRPSLIIADATRVLQTRGPKGPGLVTQPHQIVAGIDPVAVDAYCTRYLTVKGVTPDAVPHLCRAFELNRGTMDVSSLRLRELASGEQT